MPVLPFAKNVPRVGARVFVSETAVVLGDVELADDVGIWFGVVLRADLQAIRIGARSNIQDRAVVHVDEPDLPTIIGEEVTVGHGAILHGCRVESGALVGMNATVLNGAVVGEGAIVAAATLVPPRMVVPARTLVAGVPAKLRRELTEEELAQVRRGVTVYLSLKEAMLAASSGEKAKP